MSKWNYGLDKTYTSASEAFRDADYATPIWRCETEWERTKAYLPVLTVLIIGGLLIYGLHEALKLCAN